MQNDITRPIIGIENRTAQEVFDIMCDRFRHLSAVPDGEGELVERLRRLADYVEQQPPVHYEDEAASAMREAASRLSQGTGVTDEMVERFGQSFYGDYYIGSEGDKSAIRAALETALSGDTP